MTLSRSERHKHYAKVAKRLAYYQRRNRTARLCHTKTRHALLHSLGHNLDTHPPCLPSWRQGAL